MTYTKNTPKVSIIIPVYNGSKYMKEAIDSAINQTYENIEIIVVNDGSCDSGKTEEIALSYGDKIRYIKKENGGVSSALNIGIKNMTGEYFSWLSHDDKYELEKVEKSVDYLSEFEEREHIISFCGAYYINEESKKIKDSNYLFEKNKVYNGNEMLEYLLKKGTINGCCMLIPRRTFEECGYFDENLRYNQDTLMWYKIFLNGYGMIADINRKNVMYRLHAEQTSKTRRDLLLKDSHTLSKMVIPDFIKNSTGSINLLKLYAKQNAKHYLKDAVNECIIQGRKSGCLSEKDILEIKSYLFYGKIRSFAKNIYNRLKLKR